MIFAYAFHKVMKKPFIIVYIIMAFTRFHDDPARIQKQLQQQTDQGRWAIDVPGNGDKPCFMLDPQITKLL